MELSPDSIYVEMEKIVASQTFRSAARQRSFLRYAVTEQLEGRGHLLKEYSIGIAVFQKDESFDPRVDSIVRSEARKLRARLAKYFGGEGNADAIRIQIPVGKYAPVFTEVSRAEFVSSTAVRRQAVRIMVLPFVSRSSDSRDHFFSDGLTDELTHAFAQVRGLEVIARTSAFQFKSQAVDVRQLGRQFNVHAVMEGSIRRSQNRVRIIATLADAMNGHAVWSSSYDRRLSDRFAVQQELSTTITRDLWCSFSGNSPLCIQDANDDDIVALNPKGYGQYLQGQYFSNRYTLEDYEASIGCFQQAIQQKPEYARAYSSLARSYVMLPFFKAMLASHLIRKIRAAASKALELDSSVGEAHVALAVPLIYDFRWSEAGEEFRKGLELCPSDLTGQAWYGTYLLNIGRQQEGLLAHKRVSEREPDSPLAAHNYGLALYFSRRYDEAVEQYRKALALNAAHAPAHAGLGVSCIQKKSYVRGIAELKQAQQLTPGFGRVKSTLAYAYAVSGNPDKARETLNEFIARFQPDSFPALMIAEIYIGLGNKDSAFEWLHRAIDQKDLSVFLRSDPLYDPLRKDPRFLTLLKRTNLA